MTGTCVLGWVEDPKVQGTHNMEAVMCGRQMVILRELLRVALSEPECLSSTDRNAILSAINSPVDLVRNTRFLISELERRTV